MTGPFEQTAHATILDEQMHAVHVDPGREISLGNMTMAGSDEVGRCNLV